MNIVAYLAHQNPAWSAGDSLSGTEQAHTLAYTSYILSRGSALVAFSLYVSPSAWANLTRPAYSALLPFPLTWTIPLKIRSDAIARTEHLGLDHLAADVDPEDGSSSLNSTTAPITSTGFLKLPLKQKVSNSMAPEQAAAIRLQSIAEDFFCVLDELRGANKYCLGREHPSSLDFLASGYLELLRVRTPHPFMKTCMERSQAGSRLAQFLDTMHSEPVRWQMGNPDEYLPWTSPKPRGITGTLGQFAESVVQNMPGLGDVWRRWNGEGVRPKNQGLDAAQVLLAAGGVATFLVAVGGVMLFRSLPPFGEPMQQFEAVRKQQRGLRQYGDVAAMFESLPDFEAMPRQPQNHTDTVYKSDGMKVAVDVEEEGLGINPPRDENLAEVGIGVKIGDKSHSL
jgi:sorting and assembly machinery component 37